MQELGLLVQLEGLGLSLLIDSLYAQGLGLEVVSLKNFVFYF